MTKIEDSAAYQRGVDWRRGRTKPEPMNWIQRLFHRHNFFPTPERRQLLGDQEWIDANTVSYAVLGEVDVEKCYDCGAKRLSVWKDGKRIARYIERPHGRPDDRWTPYLKP